MTQVIIGGKPEIRIGVYTDHFERILEQVKKAK